MEQYSTNGKKRCMGCMELYEAVYDVCPYCGSEEGESAKELLHIDPGTLLRNRYIIGQALGYGGFGVTYIAWDTQLKRKLAIKEYLPSEFATRMVHQQNLVISGKEKQQHQYLEGMKKFLQEGQKLAQVGNIDGIVHMYDCFEANNTAYITMEYLEGETLGAYLEREGKVTEQEAMDLLMPVLQALEAVHEKGIIHRDIAPDNIFLSRDANGEIKVKLIDFGAARFATTSHSKSLTVLIKPGYSPEEQYRSNGDQGTYTDVYALAAVLYRMVTGVQPPDAFERRTAIETKKRDPLEDPSSYNKALTNNFVNAMLNALNVRVEDRTATIGEFEEELISFEPVKRRGSSIRRIDFMRWPLWAKIGVPVGSVAAACLLIWGLMVAFTDPETNYELPEGMTRVPDFVMADFAEAQGWAEEAVLLIGSGGTEYVPNAAENVVLSQDTYSGAVVLENTQISVIVSTGEERFYLPDVTGMSLEYAQKALECMGLGISIVPCGQVNGLAMGSVVSQDITPYTEVKTGDIITLTVTEAGESKTGTAPDFVGLTYEEALEAAANQGVVLCVVEKIFTDDYARTQILSQDIQGGTATKDGDVVRVTMAVQMREFTMPNLLYKPIETAKQLMKNIGIDVNVETSVSEIIAKDLVAGQSVGKDQKVLSGETVVLTVSSGSKPFAMTNVVGKTEEEARKTLTDSNLVINVAYDYDAAVPEGNVISQTVAAGSNVTRGTAVTIVVCSTKDLVKVSDVTGMKAEDARKLLEEAGLTVIQEEVYSSSDEDAGMVMTQLPVADSYQKSGSKVVLTVSKGEKRISVPNVVGSSGNSAASVLKSAGFGVQIKEVYDKDSTKGKVISQSPESGSSQKEGTTVMLNVSLGTKPVEKPTEKPSSGVTTKPTEGNKKPAAYTVSWNSGTGYSITVQRTSSPTANASVGTLNSGATVYQGDVLNVTYTASTGYTITSKGSTSVVVSGNVTSSNIYCTAAVSQYTATWNGGTGYTITVNRTSSPYKGASTGVLGSGTAVYYGDVLNITYTKADYYTITSKGSTAITVTGNVTASQIYATAQQNAASGWVKASEMPSGAQVVTRKWTYTQTTTKESTEASMDGYTQTGSYWVKSGSGSTNYSTAFPGGFDTGNWIYTSFAKSPYSSYEDSTSKREVSNSWAGYVYWHWMFDCDRANGTAVRSIYNQYGYGAYNGYLYKYFGAFTSTNGSYSSSSDYCNNLGITNYIVPEKTSWDECQGSTRWFRFDYYTSSYTDYYKMFQYSKTENKESTTEVVASGNISNVQEWVQYRAK